jgi:hypothetical protein
MPLIMTGDYRVPTPDSASGFPRLRARPAQPGPPWTKKLPVSEPSTD